MNAGLVETAEDRGLVPVVWRPASRAGHGAPTSMALAFTEPMLEMSAPILISQRDALWSPSRAALAP
jgi:hypothetical protein